MKILETVDISTKSRCTPSVHWNSTGKFLQAHSSMSVYACVITYVCRRQRNFRSSRVTCSTPTEVRNVWIASGKVNRDREWFRLGFQSRLGSGVGNWSRTSLWLVGWVRWFFGYAPAAESPGLTKKAIRHSRSEDRRRFRAMIHEILPHFRLDIFVSASDGNTSTFISQLYFVFVIFALGVNILFTSKSSYNKVLLYCFVI